MTKEDVIRIAEQAGAHDLANVPGFTDFLTSFAALVAEAEREACAKVCNEADRCTHPADLAADIRARGEK
jgi:hypothetical protein